jgi:RNA polymerase sigma-70 factor (ECF subfamily)
MLVAAMEGAADITAVLLSWNTDPKAAVDRLIPIVHAELRKIAASLMRSERPNHTIEPTVLVNEVYLHLVRQDAVSWKDRAHFFGIAARLMRQILIDYARRRSSQKRGGGMAATLREPSGGPNNLEVLLDLEDALQRMQAWDERKLQVVELHYFGGLKAEEIAEALDLTLPTVRRDLLLGRAWLKEQFA